jgi:hypothetical protein
LQSPPIGAQSWESICGLDLCKLRWPVSPHKRRRSLKGPHKRLRGLSCGCDAPFWAALRARGAFARTEGLLPTPVRAMPYSPAYSSSALRPRRWATLTSRSRGERYTVRSARKRLRAWAERSPLTRSPLEEATTVFENSTACAPLIENRSWCASRFDPSRERFGEPGDGKESSREVPRHRWDHGVWVPITYDSFS